MKKKKIELNHLSKIILFCLKLKTSQFLILMFTFEYSQLNIGLDLVGNDRFFFNFEFPVYY